MTVQNHYREGPTPRVGDVYAWMGAHLKVLRLTKRYASVVVRSTSGATWRKRQPLPLPADARPCAHPDDEACDCARLPDGDPE